MALQTEASRPAARPLLARLALAAALALPIAACGRGEEAGEAGEAGARAEAPQNILVVLTDDQPTGTVKRMPELSRAPGFLSFGAYYDNNPLCCPTRATLLTGLYSHHHRIETNLVARRFDDSRTLATSLDAAGYETGLFGKYLNSYPWSRPRNYVPPGWDRWSAFTPDASYYDYTLVGEGGRRHYGSGSRSYSTDVLAGQVDRFIRTAESPYFALFAPYAPHAPRTPAPRHRNAFAGAKVSLARNFNRVADGAPRYWRGLPKLDRREQRTATRDQWRSLLAVDEAIGRLLRTIEREGEAESTVIIFVSDNGYSLGSHRNRFKDCAYEECIHLPLMIRWPGVTTGGTSDALVGSVDLAPTIAEIAGAAPPREPDGESLVPLLRGEVETLERPVLLRHVRYPKVAPSFWGVRTERWTYVIYPRSGERELYDNLADPEQLDNRAGEAANASLEARLEAQIAELRGSG